MAIFSKTATLTSSELSLKAKNQAEVKHQEA